MKKSIWLGFSFALTLILLIGCTPDQVNEDIVVNPDENISEEVEDDVVTPDENVAEEPEEDVVILDEDVNEEVVEEIDEPVTPEINTDPEGDTATDPLVTLATIADEIIVALNDRDMATIDTYVHASQGLLFSPYVYVKLDAVHIPKQDILTLLDSTTVLDWGVYDGIGTPILLTPSDYFDEFLDMSLFLQPDEINLNQFPEQRGNMIPNLMETFPESVLVDYYHEGTAQYHEMDWASVILVFLQDDSADYYLIAIVRDMWTI